jgi:RHS repeat-associated protein
MRGNIKSPRVSGTSYYRARYYDPQAGRFTGEDPIRFRADTNFYEYVENNPIVMLDPSGLVARLFCEHIPSERGSNTFEKLVLAVTVSNHCYLWVSCHGSGKYLELYGPQPNDPKHGEPHFDQPRNLDRENNSMEIPLFAPSTSKCCEFEDRLVQAYYKEIGNLPIYNGLGPNSGE